MPNIPQQDTIIQYVANVSQLQYTFAFYAIQPTNLNVYYQAPNATPIPASDILVYGSDYTVTFNSDPTTGGYITLLFTPTTGYYLTIELNLAYTLNTNFAAAATFNGGNLDAALDYLLMLIQQNANYIFNRNLSYVVNSYLPNAQPYTQLPTLALNQVWIGSAGGVIAATIATVPSASVLQSALANNAPSTNGASLVGYYDTLHSNPSTVAAFLNNIEAQASGNYGASYVGFYNSKTSTATTVGAFLATMLASGFPLYQPNIIGVTDGSNAAAGSVGEFLTANLAYGSAVNVVDSGMAVNILTLSLTAGDWDVWGNMQILFTGNASTAAAIWVSTTSASAPDPSSYNSVTPDANCGGNVPMIRVSTTTTKTVYLTVVANFTTGSAMCSGNISARRVR